MDGQRQECQIFSRVTWWLVPRHAMNPGKLAEFADRKYYSNGKIYDKAWIDYLNYALW